MKDEIVSRQASEMEQFIFHQVNRQFAVCNANVQHERQQEKSIKNHSGVSTNPNEAQKLPIVLYIVVESQTLYYVSTFTQM